MNTISLIGGRTVYGRAGKGRETIRKRIADRTFVPPIAGKNPRLWIDAEVDAVVRADAAGWSPEKIRALVDELVAARSALAPKSAAKPARDRRAEAIAA